MNIKAPAKKKAILKELQRRTSLKEKEIAAPIFDLNEFLFGPQRAFILDPTKFKTGVCSRRSGKTVGCGADLLYSAKHKAGITNLYITLSRKNAKRIIWRELLRLNKKFELGGKVDNQELSITFEHADGEESVVYVTGAKDAQEIEKFRGLALYKVYIDEAQSFRAYLQELIDDIIIPALWDYNGYLTLIGTPGPICVGTFFEACHDTSGEWAHHHWTILDNPHIKRLSGMEPEAILARERKRRGIDESDPTYRRESLGQWVQDNDVLVYKYNRSINHYEELPKIDGNWYHIFGIDIGYDDSDAIAVLAYSDKHEHVFLVDEFVQNKMTITELANQIKVMRDHYKPVKMVMDAGALGKKIQMEIQQRHSLLCEPAEKARKFEFITLLNDDLRTGRLRIKHDSRCAEDYHLIQWDRNADKLKVSDVYHSDIADAVLYAWREAHHFAYRSPDEQLVIGSDTYMDDLEAKEAQALDDKKKGHDQMTNLYDLNKKGFWEQ